MTIVHFTTLAGAQIYYPPAGLKPRKVALESAFYAKLEAMFADLWARCPWGPAQWIGSLGCMVPSTPGHDTGRHDTGEAFDLASVMWMRPDGTTRIMIYAGDPASQIRQVVAGYLAVEAVIRMHFQTALDWWFDAAHRDHWHIDTGRGEPTWEERSNQVRFLQAALRYVWGAEGPKGPLEIDGVLGAETSVALARSDADATESTLRGKDSRWPRFLEETARGGFAK